MREALKEAQKAFSEDEVPVGSIIVYNNTIIAKGYNMCEKLCDPTAHAEMQVVTSACNYLQSKYLDKCIMYTTLEPCAMCAGATFFAGVRAVVFGLSGESLTPMWATEAAPEPSLLEITCRDVFDSCKGHPTAVIGPIMEEEAVVPHLGFWDDDTSH